MRLEAWCRPEPPDSDQTDESDGTCTRYQAEGEYCGGYAPEYGVENCHPDLACIDQNPLIMDEPGMCMQPCTTDSECTGNMVCNDLTPDDSNDFAGYCEPNACTNDAGCSSDSNASFCYNQEGCMSDNDIGECIVPPEICTQQHDPVCGCDGVVYSNGCYAMSAEQNYHPNDDYYMSDTGCLPCGGMLAPCPDEELSDIF